MAYALARCDRVPAYLESSNPRNIPFYRRYRGILKAIDILKTEIHQNMALLGAVALDDIDGSFVVCRDRD